MTRWSLDWDRVLRLLLTALFGSLIVAAFVYEAIEAAATLGWVAYPIVFGTGLVSFLLARAAYCATADCLLATVQRRELDAETDALARD